MMKLLSTCFLTAALYGTEAQADTSLPAATPFAGVDKKLPMLELLPVGQVLPKVSLSRYEGPRLSMLLTASSVTVAAPQEIAANILNVYLYGKNNQTSHLFTQAAAKLYISKRETARCNTALSLVSCLPFFNEALINKASLSSGFVVYSGTFVSVPDINT